MTPGPLRIPAPGPTGGIDWEQILAQLAPAGALSRTARGLTDTPLPPVTPGLAGLADQSPQEDDPSSPVTAPDPGRFIPALEWLATQRATMPAGGSETADLGTADSTGYSGGTGVGALSGSQALSAFGSGLGPGLIGQGLTAAGVPGLAAGSAGKLGLSALGTLGGFPTFGLSVANSFFGGLASLADAAGRSVGPRGPSPTLSDSLRANFVDMPDPPTEPDPTDPTGFLGDPTGQEAEGFLGDPTGQESLGDAPADGLGDGDGDGLGDGDGDGDGLGDGDGDGAWQHGGDVRGPGGIDNVPGWLTDGEFVVDEDSARKFRGLLGLLNQWEP